MLKKIHHELSIVRKTPPLKAYVIDDGWQESSKNADWSKDVWPVNKKFDPHFQASLNAVKEAQSTLGLWLSPSCNFGAKAAVPHMRAKNWGALSTYMSLANTPYMDLLEKRMWNSQKMAPLTLNSMDSLDTYTTANLNLKTLITAYLLCRNSIQIKYNLTIHL